MKLLFSLLLTIFLSPAVFAQDTARKDSSPAAVGGLIVVEKDPRLEQLAKKELEFNQANANALKAGKGYRLMLLSTSDKNLALKLRAQLLQRYPDQKVYMSFQPPYIKLKFGNFLEREEADNFRKELVKAKIVTGNIYIVPEIIEIKPDKNKDNGTP